MRWLKCCAQQDAPTLDQGARSVDPLVRPTEANREILLYCTGGIRCEKPALT
jgi:predicted sulfurtransferase